MSTSDDVFPRQTTKADLVAAGALDQALALRDGRNLEDRSVGRSDVASAYAIALGYLAVAVAFLWTAPRLPSSDLILALLLSGIYLLASRTAFETSMGACVPTQPVLVVMLFALPVTLVPSVVAVLLMIGALVDHGGEAFRLRHVAVRLIGGWHCVGPVLVLGQWGHSAAARTLWFVALGALGAQFAFDAAFAALRCRALKSPVAQLVEPLRWVFLMDSMLALIGYGVAMAAPSVALTALLLLAPIGVVRLLASDRQVAVDTSVTLGEQVLWARHEAETDGLTGLLNRRGWIRAVESAEAWLLDNPQGPVAVLFADLDGLKVVNDAQGHDAGDRMIVDFGRHLARVAPVGASVARLGGDEYAVLLVGASADAFATCVEALHVLRGTGVSASIGVAAVPPAPTFTEACHVADNGVYRDKIARFGSARSAPRTVVEASR